MDSGQVWADIITGCVVAAFVAVIAWFGTGLLTRRHESATAKRERDLAAAEQFYAVYGEFFATWKAWEFVRGRSRSSKGTVSEHTRQDLLARAAECEGRYESLIVRVVLEHRLRPDARTMLWAMRFALKELRHSIRDDKPLGWWRTDDPSRADRHEGSRRYAAFKALASSVASIMVDADPRSPRPSAADRQSALAEITGTVSPPNMGRPPTKGRQWIQALHASES